MAAGFVQGVSGFGLGLVAMAFWAGVMPPQIAAPLIALGSVAGQALTLPAVWASLDLRRAAPMIAAGLAGIPLGLWMLPYVDQIAFRFWVGVLLCLYCPALLFVPRMPPLQWGGEWANAGSGLVGGIMGGLAGLSGLAPVLWMTLRGWDPGTTRSIIQAFLIAAQMAGLAGFVATGFVTADVWRLAAWTMPLILVASLTGSVVYGRFSGEGFRRLVLALLTLAGASLVAQGFL